VYFIIFLFNFQEVSLLETYLVSRVGKISIMPNFLSRVHQIITSTMFFRFLQ
jgi:hypothetical protein